MARLYFKHFHSAFNIMHVQYVKHVGVHLKGLGLGLLEHVILKQESVQSSR